MTRRHMMWIPVSIFALAVVEAQAPRTHDLLLTGEDAYMLCSLAADLLVMQAVDATKGVHASLAKSLFR